MRAFIVAAALLFAIVPTYAQGPSFGDGNKKEEKEMEAKRQVEQDKAYKSSIQRIPAKESPADPWGSMRGSPAGEGTPQSKPKKIQPTNPAR